MWVLAVGELSKRKNHEVLIRAIAQLDQIFLTIAGQGKLREYLTDLIDKLNVGDRVRLLGYRDDISELCRGADIFALPSFQEGLPVALMEAMACGLPCVVSRIRGNVDLIDENGGFHFDPHSVNECRKALELVLKADWEKLGEFNRNRVEDFSTEKVLERTASIYEVY